MTRIVILLVSLMTIACISCGETDLPGNIDCKPELEVTVIENPDFVDGCRYAFSSPNFDYLLLPTNIYDHIDSLTDGMTITIKYVETPDVVTICNYGRVILIECLEN